MSLSGRDRKTEVRAALYHRAGFQTNAAPLRGDARLRLRTAERDKIESWSFTSQLLACRAAACCADSRRRLIRTGGITYTICASGDGLTRLQQSPVAK